jgi:hypothetical protein
MDFQKIIEQFKDTEGIEFIWLIKEKWIDGDEWIYEILTNKGNMYVYEVDYIGNLQTDVINPIKWEIGEFEKLYELKSIVPFEEANPVTSINLYVKPPKWDEIAKYANDKFGSEPYYFNFLVKK